MATTEQKEVESDIVLNQFKKNLDHIRIDKTKKGPEITVGETVLTFKKKAPVSALASLLGGENRVEGMTSYLRKTLVGIDQYEAFDALMEEIDIDGLAEILNALGEGYTSFPEKS